MDIMGPEQNIDLPETIVTELDQCSDQQLRDVITYAQQLLKQRHDPTVEIEPRHENEEIVSIEDKEGDTLVIVERKEEPMERVVYHVSYEPDPDGGEGEYHWRYLGPVVE